LLTAFATACGGSGGTITAVGDPVPINGGEADGGFDPTAPIDEGPTGDAGETAPDNPEPSNGAYGLVSMTAINRSDVEATAWFDLTFGLAGGDGQEFADTDCRALEANGLAGSDPVQPGASISADVCLDIDPASLDAGTLFVEETGSFDGTRAFWATE